ncbi:general substrate transporter [Dipodascopsis uninucleata]
MYTIYNIYAIAASAALGGILDGFDIGSMSAFINIDSYRSYFNYPTSIKQGGITSSMAGGSFLGSLGSGYISDRYGRKIIIQIASLIWIVGSVVQCSAHSVEQLIIGRVLSGVAIGQCTSQVPVYIAELSPKESRGRMIAVFELSLTAGVMIMYYISYGCTFIHSTVSWRLAWGLQMIPGILMFFLIFILPESPRWLASHDRWEETELIISRLEAQGKSHDVEETVRTDLLELHEVIRLESSQVTLMNLFAKGTRTRTFVGIFSQIWQQLTGINIMMYYIVEMFIMANYSGNAGLVSSSIIYVVNFIACCFSVIFIDHWGRRPLLIYGAILQAAFLFIVGGVMAGKGHYVDSLGGNANIRWVVPEAAADKSIIAFTCLFVATFALTWGPGVWIYVPEIFPLRQRAVANGLCSAANWIFNFALGLFVPSAFQNLQWKTYIVFGTFCLAMCIHVFFMFPETVGKSLEEIDIIWEKKVPAWRTASIDTTELATNRDLLNGEDEKVTSEHAEQTGDATCDDQASH